MVHGDATSAAQNRTPGPATTSGSRRMAVAKYNRTALQPWHSAAALLFLFPAVAAAADGTTDAWTADSTVQREMEEDGLMERCDVTTVHAPLSDEEFLELREKDRPFLVRGMIGDWGAHERWTKQYLRERYGHLVSNSGMDRQRAGSIKTFGLAIMDRYAPHQTLTLANYLDSLGNRTDLEFLFGDVAKTMLDDASNPRQFSELGLFGTEEDVMVSIAPSRIGFPLHAHGRSWMGLVHGHKLWVMYHPESMVKLPPAVYDPLVAKQTHWEWFRDIYRTEISQLPEDQHPVVCMQKPGEVLVLPDYWYHLTINVGEAVGFGAQDNTIATVDKAPLYLRYKQSGRAAFELAEGIRAGQIDPRSVRGLIRRSVRPELASSTALSKLLKTAAASDPLELPFVAGLIQHRYAEGDAEGGRQLLQQVVARLQALIANGHCTRDRAARPLGALGSQLLAPVPGGEAPQDIDTAKWLLQTSLDLDPTPPVQYFLARVLAAEGGANLLTAVQLCKDVVRQQPENRAALDLLEQLSKRITPAAGGDEHAEL